MKICIDAGHNHSGWDTGAAGNGLKEQDITWLIADKLRQLLESAGVDVVMTRTSNEHNLGSDVNSCLRKRAEICNANKCDYFVSVHCNAGGGTGTEVLVVKKGGQAETLAGFVLKYVSKITGKSRGVKESNAYVLKHTDCPAILVETAFIDTEADSLLLRYHHDDFAKAIFRGICGHCKIKETLNQLESVNDIVYALASVGLISDKELWLKKLEEDKNSYWLARKFANYIRRN